MLDARDVAQPATSSLTTPSPRAISLLVLLWSLRIYDGRPIHDRATRLVRVPCAGLPDVVDVADPRSAAFRSSSAMILTGLVVLRLYCLLALASLWDTELQQYLALLGRSITSEKLAARNSNRNMWSRLVASQSCSLRAAQ